ncbi:MAG: nickel pincer cofactor biosynthesis protein LarB [Methanobacterium sp.]|uniref:nickel pincer cofactor biosynthesis protein LarB n=1 Tax=Methanobacterium sp. TaxID=2164 RepID=UPI003D654398|nr:nickel pincer cofactor biosynthesis protein LarB [Methanobacterium sp.]
MREILQKLLDKEISIQDAEKMLKTSHIEELEDFAKIDTCRHLRTGIPEVIFAENKEDEDLLKIILNCAQNGHVMVTRLSKERYELLKPQISVLSDNKFKIEYNRRARILVIKDHEIGKEGKIGILTAGTSDIPVAEEARITAEEMGCETIVAYDAGVAGMHRVFSPVKKMLEEEVKAIVVVAGMEGALPSVVTGLVDVPVIGVPTSIGYGVGEGGFTALFAMLQSCAPGIAVVNIDNGFGAGVFAAKLAKQTLK